MASSERNSCSICTNWHRMSEYDYGNKLNRSYCQQCNKEERKEYSKGGKEAAKTYRGKHAKKDSITIKAEGKS